MSSRKRQPKMAADTIVLCLACSFGLLALSLVIPGLAEGENPESMNTVQDQPAPAVFMDSGFRYAAPE